jgi:thioredoxin 1
MADLTELTQDDFQTEVLESNIPVLVDFWAPWCGPCRRVAPLVEEMARQYAGRVKVVKIDVDQSQELAGGYGVNSVPTLMIFKNGQVVDRLVGIPPKSRLDSALSEVAG